MDWLKKYWWMVLLAPVVIYFLWEYYKGKRAVAEKMKVVRQAKEDKAVIERAESGEGENV